MSHLTDRSPLRWLRWMAVATAVALVLPLAAGGRAEAARDASITLTADKQNVKAGDNDTLHIRLQNVKNATLDGQALKGDKIDRKLLVCETTTYTVEATDAGGQKISQSLTIYASGATTKATCLPDLAVKSLWTTPGSVAGDPTRWEADPSWIIQNRGSTTAPPFDAVLTENDGHQWAFTVRALKPGETDFGFVQWSPLYGTVGVFTLVIDPKNQVAESDKTNNTKSLTITAQEVIQLLHPGPLNFK